MSSNGIDSFSSQRQGNDDETAPDINDTRWVPHLEPGVKVLVTGGTGYVGAWAARALEDAGHEVRLLVRSAAKVPAVPGAIGVRTSDIVLGDITDRRSIEAAVKGCEGVVHAAAAVSLSRREAAKNLEITVSGARNVLNAAVEEGAARVVHISSISALDLASGPLTTNSPLSPSSGYARTKSASEQIARELQAAGAPLRILYPGGVCGPAAGESLGEASKEIAAFAAGGVMPTRAAALPIVDARDVADVVVQLIERQNGPARVMAGGATVNLPELASHLRELTGRRFPVLPLPGAALRMLGRFADHVGGWARLDLPFSEEAMRTVTLFPGTIDNVAEVGVTYRPLRETLSASVLAWLETGAITPKQAGRLRS